MAKWRTFPQPVDVFVDRTDGIAIITDADGNQSKVAYEDLLTNYRPAGPSGAADMKEIKEALGEVEDEEPVGASIA